MIPAELEKPKITEIKVRMDCNGCVQKIKKALYGINGIYDIYIDFPQQKVTIVGWADPERIMKAIKKTRKIATICSNSEQTTDPAQPVDHQPPTGGETTANIPSIQAPPTSQDAAVVAGSHGHSHAEVAPGHVVAHDAHSGLHSDPTNLAGQQPAQPHGSHEAGQVHIAPHQPPEPGHAVHHQGPEHGPVASHQPEHSHLISHQLPDHGQVSHHQPPMHGHVVHNHQPEHSQLAGHQQPPMHGHVVHSHQPELSHVAGQHQPPDHNHVVHHHQPPDHSHVVHHQPPEHSHGHVIHHHPTEHSQSQAHAVQHHQSEHAPHGYTSSYNYHHNIPGAVHMPTSTPPMTVIHSYNTYKPSPYVTEYVRPLTSHRPSPYVYEYIPQQPATHYSPRMDRYYEDYYNTGTSSNNGNITSIFSDENPNACNLM